MAILPYFRPPSLQRVRKHRPLTTQKAFEISARHLLAQGVKSVLITTHHDSHAYRGLEGRRCAIGALIPNRSYRRTMVRKLVARLQEEYGLFPGIRLAVLEDLQEIHDLFEPDVWRERLRYVAVKHGLIWPALL